VADRVVMMDQGAVVEIGTARQIFTAPAQERTQAFFRALR